MSVVWTGGDPDQMADMGVIGDPIPNGDEERYGDEEPGNEQGEEEWA